jgi:hypothetical protein
MPRDYAAERARRKVDGARRYPHWSAGETFALHKHVLRLIYSALGLCRTCGETPANGDAYCAKHNAHVKAYRQTPEYKTRHRLEVRTEKARALQRIRAREKVDANRAKYHRRRAKKAGLHGSNYSSAEFRGMCVAQDERCSCCGRRVPLHGDHIAQIDNMKKGLITEPVTGGNSIENIQPLCASCNFSRNARIGAYDCVCGRHHEDSQVRIVPATPARLG